MTRDTLATASAMLIVEIDGSGIEQGRTYTDKKDGLTKPLRGRQNGFLWQGGKYPITISIDIPDGKPPYAPGSYVLCGSLFEAGKFGRMEFKGTRDLTLISVAMAAEALAAVAAEESKPSKAA